MDTMKRYFVLFYLGFVYSYVITFFVLDTIWSMIQCLYYASFSHLWVNSSGGSSVSILVGTLDMIGFL